MIDAGTAPPGGRISAAEEAFERWRRVAGAVLAPLAFALVFVATDGRLTPEGQRHFIEAEEVEYPMLKGLAISPKLQPLAEIETPDIDLSKLSDLKGTLKLLRDVGALE